MWFCVLSNETNCTNFSPSRRGCEDCVVRQYYLYISSGEFIIFFPSKREKSNVPNETFYMSYYYRSVQTLKILSTMESSEGGAGGDGVLGRLSPGGERLPLRPSRHERVDVLCSLKKKKIRPTNNICLLVSLMLPHEAKS